MTTPLLITKLLIPPAGHSLVDRPRLLARLDDGGQRVLTLVCAPAGYGKSTLLTEWISGRQGGPGPGGQISFCWVALDEADNDAARFLSYVQAALEPHLAPDGSTADMVQTFPLPPVQTILTTLINDLHQSGLPVTLILDDYQLISNTAIHEGLTFFLDHLPPNVHVVIATRSDPPLPLARLRARGQLVEIRADELRFSLEEASHLLNQVIGLELGAQEVTRLEQRTEGWVAGLQMAALALRSVSQTRPAETAAYVANFSGSNRYILDYLVEEVLKQQPEDIQTFLLETSILHNLSGPLCDAVTKSRPRDAAGAGRTGQQSLEELERANLFLMPLDSERCWFRYHQLFADLLRLRLEQLHPERVSELYVRASKWYESQELVPEAIAQALAAPDRTCVADLLERVILTFYFRSEITQVHHWLDLLPKPFLLHRALLCAVYAAAIALLPPYPPDSLPAAEEWMLAAERALSGNGQSGTLARAFICSMRSFWARFRGEPHDTVAQLIANALSLLPADSNSSIDRNQLCMRSALETNLGLTHWTAGYESAAQQAFSHARLVSRASGDLFNESQSICSLANLSFLHGQLGEAARICREGLAFFDSQQVPLGHRAPYSGQIGIQLAEILIERNELAEAERLLLGNIELAKWTMGHNILIRGHLALARVAAARGDPAAALEYLDEAEKTSRQGELLAGAQRAALQRALSGQHPEYGELARRWGQPFTLVEFRQGPPEIPWIISLALARLILLDPAPHPVTREAAPSQADCLAWLGRQKRAVQARGWAHWEIQLGVIECLSRRRMGDTAGSLAIVRRVLDLAEPGGYTLIFAEQGKPMQTLLHTYLQTASPAHHAYVQRLAALVGGPAETTGAKSQPSDLVEPLTSRELEILRELAAGLSNRQIAGKLFLAEGTVKFHVHSVLEKLGVHSRTQALAEAKRHNLL